MEIRRIMVQGQPGKQFLRPLSQSIKVGCGGSQASHPTYAGGVYRKTTVRLAQV
jgi:hypothetical protein